MQLQEMAYGLILGICAVVLVMCVIAAIMSENIRNTVIASVAYKRAFALHMNIFSHLYNKALRKRKEELFALMKKNLQTVQGEKLILEIGAGTGANFEFLPEGSFLIALDPNAHMEPYLEENVKKFSHVHLKKFVCGPAENMHVIPDDSVEAVVCTLTLCSVEDLRATLAEITRVIKPGGHFYFLEHVADESGTWRNTFQHKLENLWKYFGDGCSCTCQTWTFLDNAGFSQVHYEKFLMSGLRVICYLMRPHIVGYAVK